MIINKLTEERLKELSAGYAGYIDESQAMAQELQEYRNVWTEWSTTERTNLRSLIICEISDFFAGFGCPGEPETPEEMQRQLINRVGCILNDHVVNYPRCEALVEILKECRTARDEAQAELQEYRKAEKLAEGWVKCSERMPNDKDYVWCWGRVLEWTEDDGFEAYHDATRNKWWAVTMDGEEPVSKVTHWMPLPAAPQQEVK